jgi:hypothetical protein
MFRRPNISLVEVHRIGKIKNWATHHGGMISAGSGDSGPNSIAPVARASAKTRSEPGRDQDEKRRYFGILIPGRSRRQQCRHGGAPSSSGRPAKAACTPPRGDLCRRTGYPPVSVRRALQTNSLRENRLHQSRILSTKCSGHCCSSQNAAEYRQWLLRRACAGWQN